MVLGYTRPGHRQVHNFELQKVTQNLLQESNTESGALLGRVGGLYGRRQFGFDVASHTHWMTGWMRSPSRKGQRVQPSLVPDRFWEADASQKAGNSGGGRRLSGPTAPRSKAPDPSYVYVVFRSQRHTG